MHQHARERREHGLARPRRGIHAHPAHAQPRREHVAGERQEGEGDVQRRQSGQIIAQALVRGKRAAAPESL